MTHVVHDEFGISHTWGQGREVVFLSNPLADPVSWSSPARGLLVDAGYQVTAFEHRCRGLDWRSAVSCIVGFISARRPPVALVGWSQGAALAQEVALAAPRRVTSAALLATYGRQNEIDTVLQASWDLLAAGGAELDPLRLAMSLLTAFPPEQLAQDDFVTRMRSSQQEWAGRPDRDRRRRSAGFTASYQDRLQHLSALRVPCLVMGFGLDSDTHAARAREVAAAIRTATYVELPGLGHAAPVSAAECVWPPVIEFIQRHHHD
jgi:pimeloyl-ACP methyl ester carboxylesterase